MNIINVDLLGSKKSLLQHCDSDSNDFIFEFDELAHKFNNLIIKSESDKASKKLYNLLNSKQMYYIHIDYILGGVASELDYTLSDVQAINWSLYYCEHTDDNNVAIIFK